MIPTGIRFPNNLLSRLTQRKAFYDYRNIEGINANHAYSIYWAYPLMYSFESVQEKIDSDIIFIQDGLKTLTKFLESSSLHYNKKLVVEKEVLINLPIKFRDTLFTYCIRDSRERSCKLFEPDYRNLNLGDIKSLDQFDLVKNYDLKSVGISTTFLQMVLKLGRYDDYEQDMDIIESRPITPYHELYIIKL